MAPGPRPRRSARSATKPGSARPAPQGRARSGSTAGRSAAAGGGSGGPGGAKPSRRERATQLRTAFSLTRKNDPRLLPYVGLALLLPLAVLVAVGVLVGHPVYLGFIGLLLGLFAAVAVFGRRAQRAAYAQVEGQLGAAAAVLQNMRGNWRVAPAVAFTREQDLVHRVVGRPGVILVGEGSPHRVRGLIGNQKRLLSRFDQTPIYDVVIGDGDGQVPLRGLERHLLKLPRNIKPREVNELEAKLKALGSTAPPIPKGPMPTSGRVPRGKVR